MAELLTQLQDQVDAISRKFFETVGVLQRDAPPVSTSGEALVAATTTTAAAGGAAGGGPAPGSGSAHNSSSMDVQETVKRMTQELMKQFKATEELLQLLPDARPDGGNTGNSGAAAVGDSSGGGMVLPVGGVAAEAAAAAFKSDVQQLQAQHEAVSGQLAAAVEEVEGLLLQLQQLYAAQAAATLAAGPVPLPLPDKQQQQIEQPPQ